VSPDELAAALYFVSSAMHQDTPPEQVRAIVEAARAEAEGEPHA